MRYANPPDEVAMPEDLMRLYECRKNAPVRMLNTGRWPMVDQDDWCGEFEQLDADSQE